MVTRFAASLRRHLSAAKGSSTTVPRSAIRLIQHLDSSALGLVRRGRSQLAISLPTYYPSPPGLPARAVRVPGAARRRALRGGAQLHRRAAGEWSINPLELQGPIDTLLKSLLNCKDPIGTCEIPDIPVLFFHRSGTLSPGRCRSIIAPRGWLGRPWVCAPANTAPPPSSANTSTSHGATALSHQMHHAVSDTNS